MTRAMRNENSSSVLFSYKQVPKTVWHDRRRYRNAPCRASCRHVVQLKRWSWHTFLATCFTWQQQELNNSAATSKNLVRNRHVTGSAVMANRHQCVSVLNKFQKPCDTIVVLTGKLSTRCADKATFLYLRRSWHTVFATCLEMKKRVWGRFSITQSPRCGGLTPW